MHVILVEPSFSCLTLIPSLKQMGKVIYALSYDQEDRVIPNEYKNLIDKIIIVDTNSLAQLIEKISEIRATTEIEGIIPGSEYNVAITAQIANHFGMRGHPIETVEALRNKYFMRQYLSDTGIIAPRFFKLSSDNQVLDFSKFVEKITFPCVLKPTNMAGSLYVKKINSIQELREAYIEMTEERITEQDHSPGNEALIEEYIKGEEFSVEGVVSDSGTANIFSITKKLLDSVVTRV